MAETKSQIDQMTQFIINEAKDRAEEITTKALQEFSVEKLKVVNSTKEKIRQEYVRKAKQIETQKAIERSTEINKSRLEKIKTRQEMLAKLKEDSKVELASALSGQAKSKEFTTKLIVQGLLMLLEDEVLVRCRAIDDSMVQGCLQDAAAQYSKVVKDSTGASKTCKISLDTATKLAPPPENAQHGASCLGGVVLACQSGTITIDNTIDSRLGLVLEQAKPTIRKYLFER
jgi:V-type H+-transporting ATPase subunit E